MRLVAILLDIFTFFIGTQICGAVGINGDIYAKTEDEDHSCKITLNACEIKSDLIKLSDRDLHSLKGQKGDRGNEGLAGLPGPYGMPGTNGNHGPIGPPGVPGLDAVCKITCPERYASNSDENVTGGEGMPLDIGTHERPSDNACYMERNDKVFGDNIWVNPGQEKFEVQCKGPPTHHTCLLLQPINISSLDEMAFHMHENETENFWLSNYFDNITKKKFEVTQFYNNVTKPQLSWLRSKTKQVTQTIRYHCKNSYVMENHETALHLYSWNDISIGPTPSDRGPVSYVVMPGATHGCKPDAPKNEWRYTDITVRGSTDRLPIIDFHIRDNRKENQYFYLELREVCFG